ncbi:hypothetical protein JQ584_46080 [Bradyrhizobium liaoningense]|nr:hypothetical protein [Bradyrhizobium liaoningense]
MFGTSPNITTPTGIVKGDVGLGNVNNVVQVATVKKQVFTASGTYTPSIGMLYAIIECVGSGGGGGASAGTVGNIFIGGGGGAGGYSKAVVSAAAIGASKTVTVGAAGTGGASTPANGTAGSDVSVGTLCVAKGGSAGTFASVGQQPSGGAGGVAGTGDLAGTGAPGGNGLYSTGTVVLMASGHGGSNPWGAGGAERATTGAGNAGSGFGAGGAGGASQNVGTNSAGGNGSIGVVFITEFCSQ